MDTRSAQFILSDVRDRLRHADEDCISDSDRFGLQVQIVDELEYVFAQLDAQGYSDFVWQEVVDLLHELKAVHEALFNRFREGIRSGIPFRDQIGAYFDAVSASLASTSPAYDDFDAFLNGLLLSETIPPETKTLEQEMVYYQKTPGRVILELLERANFQEDDVFYDLGSGLGQVTLLIHLLSGIRAKGVEFEPAYVRYSERAAMDLGLTGVSFIEADVREADLSDGTVFFLYTPFTGKMLEEVLEKLRTLSERKPIRIFTYGPCTLEISVMRGWVPENPEPPDAFKLRSFRSGARQGTR